MNFTPLLIVALVCCLASTWKNLSWAARPAGAEADRLSHLTALSLLLVVGAVAHVFLLRLLEGPFPDPEPFLSLLRHAEMMIPAASASLFSFLFFRLRQGRVAGGQPRRISE